MQSHQIKCPKCGTVFKVDELSYANIVKQVRDSEFDKDLSERIHHFEQEKQSAVQLAEANATQKLKEQLLSKQAELDKLALELKNTEQRLNEREKTFQQEKDSAVSLVKAQAANFTNEKIAKSNSEISELKLKLANEANRQQALKEGYEARLKLQDEQIERLKDMKLKLSTKMVGESLEQYCQNEFNKIRATAFPNAYFDKDNEISETGSKGDFIFRDPADGVESISIMFEMKNENDDTKHKHKNEDFLAELDKDRREKKCEYAVLVSMLEAESELYNQGIVDVSYRYPKMYVIRPQFFIPIITLLKNAAEKSLATKQELALVKSQNIDITTFEEDVENWKTSWLGTMQKAGKKHLEAIKEIDETIKHLTRVREALTVSDKHLLAAENKMEDLTIKKLTRKNPTMREKFAELKTDEA